MDTFKKFLHMFMSTVLNCSLYSKEHTTINDLSSKTYDLLIKLMDEFGDIEIMLIEDDLIFNKKPVREIGLQGQKFINILKKKGLNRIDLLKGIKPDELKNFIIDFSNYERSINSYPNIRTGIIDVRIGGFKLDQDIKLDDLDSFSTEQINIVKDVYQNISPYKRLNIAGLEEIVINFILTFKKEANILKMLSPVKSYSEYTYTHAANVAVLSMFQAEAIGIKDEILRDLGISALLHDVGKLFISSEILEKKGQLTQEEWEEIWKHPYYGAVYLSKNDKLPRLAPIVALEHHLRYDGTGYPRLNTGNRKQHLCSQIVAIADYYDALRSNRPYRKELGIYEILAIMKKEENKLFNPHLLNNFIRIMLFAVSKK
jgi:HD-GYP domain-containing protein (c-di-GMP phosphodiesterase class II)